MAEDGAAPSVPSTTRRKANTAIDATPGVAVVRLGGCGSAWVLVVVGVPGGNAMRCWTNDRPIALSTSPHAVLRVIESRRRVPRFRTLPQMQIRTPPPRSRTRASAIQREALPEASA